MNETKFLVDNNALVMLTASRIRSEFFRENCSVTADVLWEASENPEHSFLATIVIAATPALLEQIRVVMKSVEPGDTGLVDLYKNLGTADPGLVASALEARAADDGKFFADEWVLVTNDHAVEKLAAAFNVSTIKPKQLAERIDAQLRITSPLEKPLKQIGVGNGIQAQDL